MTGMDSNVVVRLVFSCVVPSPPSLDEPETGAGSLPPPQVPEFPPLQPDSCSSGPSARAYRRMARGLPKSLRLVSRTALRDVFARGQAEGESKKASYMRNSHGSGG